MDPAARLALARDLFVARRFGEADAHLAILLSQAPRQAELHYWRSLIQTQSGQHDASLASIRRACALEPGNLSFQEQLGEVYLAQGRSDEAARTFDTTIRQHPDSFAALLGKGRAMEQMYEAKLPIPIPEIVGPVEKAVRLRPHNARGVTTLARMCFVYLQQFDRAEKLARQAAALDPQAAAPHLILAEVYLNSPDPASGEKAVTAAREAVKRDTRRPEPLYLLGRALLRLNDVPAAIATLERSTEIQLMPQAVYQLSLAHARAGNREKAAHYSRLYDSWNRFAERRKTLLALLKHRPSDVRIHAQLAELYLDHGARDPARHWARAGLALRPEDARLRRVLARVGG
jgi:predicted Zn-dependent protease